MKKKELIILGCIIIVAIFLRFYKLSSVPPSVSLDEASIGWNAHSLLQTGRDEYGYEFPILLRAFDDWRPALYVYLVIPFVKFFGLGALAVRLPSVLLSILTISASYFLTKILFRDYKYKYYLGFAVSFLFAISPWNVYISRLGHEVNAGLFFIVLGILLFLHALDSKKRKLLLVLSAVCFSLSFYTYQSEKIFVPLMVIALAIIYRKGLWQMRKTVLYSVIVGIIVALPIVTSSFSPDALIRLKGSNAFNMDSPLYVQSAKRELEAKNKGDLVGIALNNRRVTSLSIFTTQYLSHFNPRWLFANSGDESFKAPNVGLLYYWEFPFLLIGLLVLFKTKFSSKTKALIASWTLFSFIAPAITTGAPHAMRSYNVLPVPEILTGLGILKMSEFFPKKIAISLLGIVVISQLFYFFNQYFFVFPKTQSSSFRFAFSKAVPFVSKHQKEYKKIIVSNKRYLNQSYIFFLFYTHYNAKLYQEEGGTVSGGYAITHKFNDYIFRPINYERDRFEKNVLLVGRPSDFPAATKPMAVFRNLDGTIAIEIVSRK